MSDENLSRQQIEDMIIFEQIPSDPESEDELENEEEIGSGESLVGLEELNFFQDVPDMPMDCVLPDLDLDTGIIISLFNGRTDSNYLNVLNLWVMFLKFL